MPSLGGQSIKAWQNKSMSLDKYMKIRLNSLPPRTPLPFDLFVAIGGRYVHYLRAGDSLEAEKISSFEKKAPESFYIFAADRAAYQKFVRDALLNDHLDTKQKALILRESTMVLVEEMFERPDIETALADARHVVEDFVAFMDSDASAMANLIGLSSHDFYTYNHSLDVSIYSLGLGNAVGFRGQDLKELGLGGLFHDIGKRYVSLDIICKTGPLSNEEWAQMQKHPQWGLMILEEHNSTDNIKACAFEHHESLLGNGYPQALTAPEIHAMARVVAVADTYDALTTKRSYNDPMKPTDAIELMNGRLKGKYDPEVMRALIEIFQKLKASAA
jgi:putative nucleotidyltransferase with HDIG domain